MAKTCSNCGDPVGPHGARGYCPTCYARWKRNGAPVLQVPKASGNCSNCGEVTGPHGAKGYCPNCYARWRRHGDPSVVKLIQNPGAICSECDEPAVARGYCPMHWQRWRKHDDPAVVLPGGREGNRKYTLNHEYFDSITTPEQAYWLGFIAADGGIIITPRSYALRLELAEVDAAHVQLFADAMGSDKPLWNRRGCVGVSLDSWRLVESLERAGIGQRKSATVEPWAGPADLMPHYWRGLFDGDGGMCLSAGYWHAKICGSKACVEAFGAWARPICGSRAKAIPVRPGHTCWQWQVSSNLKSQLLVWALYEDAPIALERKRMQAQELCATDFEQKKARANARRAATMRDAWATGRISRAGKT